MLHTMSSRLSKVAVIQARRFATSGSRRHRPYVGERRQREPLLHPRTPKQVHAGVDRPPRPIPAVPASASTTSAFRVGARAPGTVRRCLG
jgi:hypothetical protein